MSTLLLSLVGLGVVLAAGLAVVWAILWLVMHVIGAAERQQPRQEQDATPTPSKGGAETIFGVALMFLGAYLAHKGDLTWAALTIGFGAGLAIHAHGVSRRAEDEEAAIRVFKRMKQLEREEDEEKGS